MKVNLTEDEIKYLNYLIENNSETSIIVFYEFKGDSGLVNLPCHFEIEQIEWLRKKLNKKLVFKKLKYGELHPRLARMRTALPK